jgi:hypothetical protein
MPDDLASKQLAALTAELDRIRQRRAELTLSRRRPPPADQRLLEQLAERQAFLQSTLDDLAAVRANADKSGPPSPEAVNP